MEKKCADLEHGHGQLGEENKILKRAVGIQDGKLREALTQTQQLQTMLERAKQVMEELDSSNRQLRYQLSLQNNTYSGGGMHFDDFNHQPPPDVF